MMEQATCFTSQKMEFSIKNFFSKCDQIRRKLRIWSHLLKKCLMENVMICAVLGHKSGVAKQIKEEQLKVLENHYPVHKLSLSVKKGTKSSTLLCDVMGTVTEITILVK